MSEPGFRVVVVGNDPEALALAVMDLGLKGHAIVATASEGNGAVDECRLHRPDVLVIDHRMSPGPFGMDVAEQLARELPEMRIIIYSNYQSHELVDRANRIKVRFVPKAT
jgi:DNA-binding NarL/FixJ family response regulator